MVYPWGFPPMLAPPSALFGIDFRAFHVMQCLLYDVFVGLLATLFIARVGRTAGILLTLLLGSSVVYVGWAQSVTADFPYMAFVVLTLFLVDRARQEGTSPLEARGSSFGSARAAGAASIRREGVLLFAAIGAARSWPRGRRYLTVPSLRVEHAGRLDR